VEATNLAMYEAFESADVDRMAAVWDDVAPEDVVCVHPGWPMLRGRDHVLRSWSAVMAGTDYIQFFLTDVQVSVLGDTAVVTCTENVLTEVSERTNGAGAGGRHQRARPPRGRLAGAGAPRLPVLGRLEEA
jgi:ketosteroid isomerase-like protein